MAEIVQIHVDYTEQPDYTIVNITCSKDDENEFERIVAQLDEHCECQNILCNCDCPCVCTCSVFWFKINE
jgi:acetolactate synthase small subunit